MLKELPINDVLWVKFNNRKKLFSIPLCETTLDGIWCGDWVLSHGGAQTNYGPKNQFMQLMQNDLKGLAGEIIDLNVQSVSEGLNVEFDEWFNKYEQNY